MVGYYSREDMLRIMEEKGLSYGDLFARMEARVTENAEGIISIRVTNEWFMGSIHQKLVGGLNFYLEETRDLELEELIWGGEETRRKTLRDIACRGLKEALGERLIRDPEKVLRLRREEEYDFYLENGEIVLALENYAFAGEMAGSTEIRTGLMR